MTTSPTKSRPIEITPERKDAFRDFIMSLPRKCSPTICGIVQPSIETTTSSLVSVVSDNSSGIMDMSLSVDAQSFTGTNSNGIWSIDEYAELYGADFDNVHELEHFHEYESEHFSNHFTDESDRFFSQPTINPSPVHPFGSSISTLRSSTSEAEKENISRSTGSFIKYIESLEKSNTAINGLAFANNLVDYPDDDDEIDSDNSQIVDSNDITPKKKKAQKKLSFVDSDFVSGSFMDISAATSSYGITCGGFSMLESNDLKSKYSRYLDFSPISPISRRTPLATMTSNATSNLARVPLTSFGSNLSLNDFDDISPIVAIRLKQSTKSATTPSTSKPFELASQGSFCNIGQQIASPMSIDDLSAICSPVKTVQRLPVVTAKVDDEDNLQRQQHWDETLQQVPGHSLCNEAVFKTPASKQTRKRTNRRTKLVFNECTSTPN